MEVAQVIRDRCQCDFKESFIGQAVLLCDQQQPTITVYRANITSYGNYSSDQLLVYIEDWVKQGAIFTTEFFVVTFDPNCPVRINDLNDPICTQPPTSATIPTSASVVIPTATSTQSTPNLLVVFAVGVLVFVVIVAATIIVLITLIVCLLNRKKDK